MKMKTGADDRKKVIMLVVLLVIAVPIGVWELWGFIASPKSPQAESKAAASGPLATVAVVVNGPEAVKLSADSVDPTLHLDKLAQSEDEDYRGTGRNIFSADSIPIKFDKEIAPARPLTTTAVYVPPPPPQAPPIDLKYFGYSQDGAKSIKAFLVHGEDIFMAKSGEIIDHRYKVGNISPGSVQVTDLSYNNTQTLPISAN